MLKTKYFGEYPNIPDDFPNPDLYERSSRDTVLTEFDEASFIQSIEYWFRLKQEDERK